jgi:hypothetical protein
MRNQVPPVAERRNLASHKDHKEVYDGIRERLGRDNAG